MSSSTGAAEPVPVPSVPYGPASTAPVAGSASGSAGRTVLKTAAGIGLRVALPFIIRGVFRALSRS